jgi:hypothetical protein
MYVTRATGYTVSLVLKGKKYMKRRLVCLQINFQTTKQGFYETLGVLSPALYQINLGVCHKRPSLWTLDSAVFLRFTGFCV